jgi:hypothetical protein
MSFPDFTDFGRSCPGSLPVSAYLLTPHHRLPARVVVMARGDRLVACLVDDRPMAGLVSLAARAVPILVRCGRPVFPMCLVPS